MEHGPDHVKSVIADIDTVLADEEMRSATLHTEADTWEAKLEALHDFHALVELRVAHKEMTHAESVDALDDFVAFLSGE